MPTPKRTSIRNAFVALVTGLATTGSRVYVGRTRPLTDAQLPALLVYSGESEVIDVNLSGMAPIERNYRIRVDVMLKQNTDPEATADIIIGEIETAAFSSVNANTLGGLVSHTRLVGIGEVDLDDGLEKPALKIPMIFEVQYS